MDDWQLLHEYEQRGSEPAFAELMNRHLDLVYSAALRRLGDPQGAEEVAQSVFCLLAQKARQLQREMTLVGWLYQTASFKAAKYWRSEVRRRQREQTALAMNEADTESSAPWTQIAPLLDEAMKQLNAEDRLALLLRFFEGKPLHEIGRTLRISEDAARMRVNRALDKLRGFLLRKGAVCSAAAMGTLLTEKAVQATPVAVCQSIRDGVRQDLETSSFSPNTVSKFMHQMTLKIAASAGVALVAVFSTVLYIFNQSHVTKPDVQTIPLAPRLMNTEHQRPLPMALQRHLAALTPAGAREGEGTEASKALPPQPMIHIEARFFEMPEAVAKSVELLKSGAYRVERLAEEQTRSLVRQLEVQLGVEVLAAPKVTTLSGRQAQIQIGQERPILFAQSYTETIIHPSGNPVVSEIAYEPAGRTSEITTNLIMTGSTLDLLPNLQANGEVQMVIVPWVNEFLGYQAAPLAGHGRLTSVPTTRAGDPLPVPRFRLLQASNNVSVANGQSVLCGPFAYPATKDRSVKIPRKLSAAQPAGGRSQTGDSESASEDSEPASTAEPITKTMFVLATVTFIDPAGNRIETASSGGER